VTEQRKQQNAALEGQEMMTRRMHEEVAYHQEQLQLRTDEARKLRDKVVREGCCSCCRCCCFSCFSCFSCCCCL
jgi:hypothetical protein